MLSRACRWDVTTSRWRNQGFGTQSRNNLAVDANGELVVDLTLEMAEKVEEVTVLENATQVETANSQMGQVVTRNTNDFGGLERPQLHGSAGAAAGHRSRCPRSCPIPS